MLNDYSRDQLDRSSNDYLDRDDLGASGPGIYYALAGLLVICAVAAAFIFAGPSHEQLAAAPDHRADTTLSAPAAPTTPSLPPAAPRAVTPSPGPAPQE